MIHCRNRGGEVRVALGRKVRIPALDTANLLVFLHHLFDLDFGQRAL